MILVFAVPDLSLIRKKRGFFQRECNKFPKHFVTLHAIFKKVRRNATENRDTKTWNKDITIYSNIYSLTFLKNNKEKDETKRLSGTGDEGRQVATPGTSTPGEQRSAKHCECHNGGNV